jgi:dynein heavy chain
MLKTKNNNEDKNFAATSHNPKDNAFQVLGFPAKMSYEHRSKLRKMTGRFVRFSYLVDFIHLNGLASIFKNQIESFSSKLKTLQIESEVEVRYAHEVSKHSDDTEKEKMFNIQVVFRPEEVGDYNIIQIPMEVFDISMKIERAGEIFNPLYHIKEKSGMESSKKLIVKEELIRQPTRRYVQNICDLWVSLKPSLENVFDEVSFLIKESMTSLKYFERWSKHREMQKYINIL